jgi:hypothetical protein
MVYPYEQSSIHDWQVLLVSSFHLPVDLRLLPDCLQGAASLILAAVGHWDLALRAGKVVELVALPLRLLLLRQVVAIVR